MSPAAPLFDPQTPNGFHYRRDFVSSDEESWLVEEIGRVQFSTFEMRGVAARRRVAFFGRSYRADGTLMPPLPDFLIALRRKAAEWASVNPDTFEMALINEYPPGAPIGWHRDAPQYGIVAGISLLAVCRMKFRPYVRPNSQPSTGPQRRSATHEVTLEPRSAYLMTEDSRSAYEHHIPAVTSLRYSITFRTMRGSDSPADRQSSSSGR